MTAGRVAVIGAGWAGLAAAVELAAAGRGVDVFEASRSLGGRARRLDWNGRAIDNGQHILIGAYSETLRLMQQVGAEPRRTLRRMPLRLEFPGEFLLAAPRLPAPLHTAVALLGASGLGWAEKWAAIRLMQRLKADDYRVEPDLSVAAWLDLHRAPPRQRRVLWEPLCIAALNTPVAYASAQVLANVLRDSLGGPRHASDLLLPQNDLSSLFPEPAAAFITARGGTIRSGQRVAALRCDTDAWYVDGAGPYADVIVAVAPYHLGPLLDGVLPEPTAFDWEPIVTTYLQYPPQVRLPGAMLGCTEGCAQWLFDRGRLCGQDGLLAAVISARGRHLDLDTETLEQRIHNEIAALVPALPPASHRLTVIEKRATFACRPNLLRPAARTARRGLWLAGDYVAGDYPATLEGAVRSGVSAARQLMQQSTGA